MDSLQRVFNYNPQEKGIISSMIDFLISNEFVKKSSFFTINKILGKEIYKSHISQTGINYLVNYLIKKYD